MHIFGQLVEWKCRTFCSIGSAAVASLIISEVRASALTVETSPEITSGSTDIAAMTILWCFLIGRDESGQRICLTNFAAWLVFYRKIVI